MQNLNELLPRVIESLRQGRYINEAAVSQGIVLPILDALGWPVFDTASVSPEYSLEGRRVDFALLDTNHRPRVFIEVKRPGQAEGADRQLFEYAFHSGVPLAILTDGQEWGIYLPAEEGTYDERRVYKLDLLAREINVSTERLSRYLLCRDVLSGSALEAARTDYRDAARIRLIHNALPTAWNRLLREPDEILLELLADTTEDICGYKPSLDDCAQFITSAKQPPPLPPSPTPSVSPRPNRASTKSGSLSFTMNGSTVQARFAREVMQEILKRLADRDQTFLVRFASRKHGRKRKYISQDRLELYQGRPDLAETHSVEFVPGWWLGTNYSRDNIEDIIRLACEVAGLKYGTDVEVNLG